MPINLKYQAPLEEGKCYHIFNRAHSKLRLFDHDAQYARFLQKTEEYLTEYLDLYAYTLIPNHFHFFIKVREIDEKIYRPDYISVDHFITEQLRSLFISHTAWTNKKYELHGGLFSRPFRSVEVEGLDYYKRMMFYIHWNHVHHGMSADIHDHKFSSYHDYLYDVPSMIIKDPVFDWFGGKYNFFEEHKNQKDNYLSFKYSME